MILKTGARVRQKIKAAIEGPIMSKHFVDDDKVIYLVMDEATGVEFSFSEDDLDMVAEPNNDEPVA